jgi:hypothetical protein
MIQKISMLLFITLFTSGISYAQESNIRTYTPSKLLRKGQNDIKWFNNFYSENEDTFLGKKPRENYYTSTVEYFRGITENSRFNIGVVVNIKSTTEGKGWFTPIEFKNEAGVSRAGLTSITPSISFQPIEHIGNFSIRTGITIPLVAHETEYGVYLDRKSYIWETKFFYDYTFSSGDFQIFTELDTQLNFGKEDRYDTNETSEGGFSNHSLGVPLSVFFSYFPSNNFTVYTQAQQYVLIDLGNEFSQEYTQLGLGIKYQISRTINLETSYTNFVRGSDTGLGETLNLGLRFISN